MKQAKSQQHIMRQELALDAYLKTLLEEMPEATDDVDLPNGAGQITFDRPSPLSSGSQLLVVEPEQQRQVMAENSAKLYPLSVMPDWAQHEFQALFFKVEHLILAAPLTELSRTIKMEREPGKIPGQPSWFMGLLDEHDSRIGVLDTGQLIYGKSRGSQRDLETKPFKSILITRDKRWGLACDEILSIGRLKPEKVRWRTHRQKRPWLVGTVIEELTAIIDLQALVPHRRQN